MEKENKKDIEEQVKKKLDQEKEYHNKIIKGFFVVVIIFIVIVGAWLISSYNNSRFDYQGITGKVVKEGELILYQTTLPVMYQGKVQDYNFYFRNNPKELEIIPFNGKIEFKQNVVFGGDSDFNCDGDGIIGIANLVKLFEITGAKAIRDNESSCDPEGRYTFIEINKGEETRIDQIGKACYSMTINQCEILKATEKFMVEMFVEMNKIQNQN
ncbi:MAG: hypothetical protein ABIH59_01265 [archaeon]